MKKKFILYSILVLSVMLISGCKQGIRFFSGSYSETGEKGFAIIDLNPANGSFKLVSETNAGPNPTYFCISKKHGNIYASDEVMNFKGVDGGGVVTLKYNAEDGTTDNINKMMVPYGGPCYISLSADEDFLFFASYSSGSVAVIKLDEKGVPELLTDTIQFSVDSAEVSHPHMISFDPLGKLVYLTDLGMDRIVIYSFNSSTGRLEQIENGIVNFPKGAGPRHFTFNSEATKMYVICELNSTVEVFDVAPTGELNHLQTLTTLDEKYTGKNACADIHLGKDEKFLYGSNRGENTIVIFAVGPDGTLSPAGRTTCGGDWPRNFVIDPSGKYMLVGNKISSNIAFFRINAKTGLPKDTGKDFKITAPVCLKFWE